MAVKELIVELSRNCNLSCIMCGFGGNPLNKEWFMKRDLFQKILNEFGTDLQVVRLNGRGESTIHPEFIEMIELTRQSCPQASIHLFTNLSWEQPKLIDAFIAYGVQLFISVDSPDDQLMRDIRRGCQPKQIERNLNALRVAKARPFIVATLQERNLHQVKALASYATKHSCHLLFNTVRYDDESLELESLIKEKLSDLAEDFSYAIKLLGDNGLRCHCPDQMHGYRISYFKSDSTTGGSGDCPALTQELFVTYNGKIQPCNMFHPYILGDLKSQSLQDIQEGARWNWFSENHFESHYCKDCAHIRPGV